MKRISYGTGGKYLIDQHPPAIVIPGKHDRSGNSPLHTSCHSDESCTKHTHTTRPLVSRPLPTLYVEGFLAGDATHARYQTQQVPYTRRMCVEVEGS